MARLCQAYVPPLCSDAKRPAREPGAAAARCARGCCLAPDPDLMLRRAERPAREPGGGAAGRARGAGGGRGGRGAAARGRRRSGGRRGAAGLPGPRARATGRRRRGAQPRPRQRAHPAAVQPACGGGAPGNPGRAEADVAARSKSGYRGFVSAVRRRTCDGMSIWLMCMHAVCNFL